MFSFCSGGLLGAVLYNLTKVRASVCCYIGISQSLYGGWMELCHATGSGWQPHVFFFFLVSPLTLHVCVRENYTSAAEHCEDLV